MAFIQFVNENDYIGKIPDKAFFREDTITMYFRFYYPPDNNGFAKPINLHLGDVKPVWYLCPFRQASNPIIIKDMNISRVEKNMCSISLTSEDTKDLEFVKYTQQPVLISVKNPSTKWIRAEGSIMFKPNIKDSII